MKAILASLILIVSLSSCEDQGSKAKAVYLLFDTSGTYTNELEKAQSIINYLLATLDSGDSLAIAKIDSASFTEKDIIAKITFDSRPSSAIEEKRAFKKKIDKFVDGVKKGSRHTDITGGVIQASEYLLETGAGNKFILIFSDLEEDLPKGYVRDFPISIPDIHVVALNVTKLRSDNIDPRDYAKRLKAWEKRVVEGGGSWGVINDLEKMDRLIDRR